MKWLDLAPIAVVTIASIFASQQANFCVISAICAAGDQLALVMACERLAFPDALTWLMGDRPADPAEIERRQKVAAKSKKTTDAATDRYRKKAIASAKAIWREGVDANDTQVQAYLEQRGISRKMLPSVPFALRFHPTLDYREKGKDGWQTIHNRPGHAGQDGAA